MANDDLPQTGTATATLQAGKPAVKPEQQALTEFEQLLSRGSQSTAPADPEIEQAVKADREFKARTGLSPVDAATELMMNRASEIHRPGQVTIKQNGRSFEVTDAATLEKATVRVVENSLGEAKLEFDRWSDGRPAIGPETSTRLKNAVVDLAKATGSETRLWDFEHGSGPKKPSLENLSRESAGLAERRIRAAEGRVLGSESINDAINKVGSLNNSAEINFNNITDHFAQNVPETIAAVRKTALAEAAVKAAGVSEEIRGEVVKYTLAEAQLHGNVAKISEVARNAEVVRIGESGPETAFERLVSEKPILERYAEARHLVDSGIVADATGLSRDSLTTILDKAVHSTDMEGRTPTLEDLRNTGEFERLLDRPLTLSQTSIPQSDFEHQVGSPFEPKPLSIEPATQSVDSFKESFSQLGEVTPELTAASKSEFDRLLESPLQSKPAETAPAAPAAETAPAPKPAAPAAETAPAPKPAPAAETAPAPKPAPAAEAAPAPKPAAPAAETAPASKPAPVAETAPAPKPAAPVAETPAAAKPEAPKAAAPAAPAQPKLESYPTPDKSARDNLERSVKAAVKSATEAPRGDDAGLRAKFEKINSDASLQPLEKLKAYSAFAKDNLGIKTAAGQSAFAKQADGLTTDQMFAESGPAKNGGKPPAKIDDAILTAKVADAYSESRYLSPRDSVTAAERMTPDVLKARNTVDGVFNNPVATAEIRTNKILDALHQERETAIEQQSRSGAEAPKAPEPNAPEVKTPATPERAPSGGNVRNYGDARMDEFGAPPKQADPFAKSSSYYVQQAEQARAQAAAAEAAKAQEGKPVQQQQQQQQQSRQQPSSEQIEQQRQQMEQQRQQQEMVNRQRAQQEQMQMQPQKQQQQQAQAGQPSQPREGQAASTPRVPEAAGPMPEVKPVSMSYTQNGSVRVSFPQDTKPEEINGFLKKSGIAEPGSLELTSRQRGTETLQEAIIPKTEFAKQNAAINYADKAGGIELRGFPDPVLSSARSAAQLSGQQNAPSRQVSEPLAPEARPRSMSLMNNGDVRISFPQGTNPRQMDDFLSKNNIAKPGDLQFKERERNGEMLKEAIVPARNRTGINNAVSYGDKNGIELRGGNIQDLVSEARASEAAKPHTVTQATDGSVKLSFDDHIPADHLRDFASRNNLGENYQISKRTNGYGVENIEISVPASNAAGQKAAVEYSAKNDVYFRNRDQLPADLKQAADKIKPATPAEVPAPAAPERAAAPAPAPVERAAAPEVKPKSLSITSKGDIKVSFPKGTPEADIRKFVQDGKIGNPDNFPIKNRINSSQQEVTEVSIPATNPEAQKAAVEYAGKTEVPLKNGEYFSQELQDAHAQGAASRDAPEILGRKNMQAYQFEDAASAREFAQKAAAVTGTDGRPLEVSQYNKNTVTVQSNGTSKDGIHEVLSKNNLVENARQLITPPARPTAEMQQKFAEARNAPLPKSQPTESREVTSSELEANFQRNMAAENAARRPAAGNEAPTERIPAQPAPQAEAPRQNPAGPQNSAPNSPSSGPTSEERGGEAPRRAPNAQSNQPAVESQAPKAPSTSTATTEPPSRGNTAVMDAPAAPNAPDQSPNSVRSGSRSGANSSRSSSSVSGQRSTSSTSSSPGSGTPNQGTRVNSAPSTTPNTTTPKTSASPAVTTTTSPVTSASPAVAAPAAPAAPAPAAPAPAAPAATVAPASASPTVNTPAAPAATTPKASAGPAVTTPAAPAAPAPAAPAPAAPAATVAPASASPTVNTPAAPATTTPKASTGPAVTTPAAPAAAAPTTPAAPAPAQSTQTPAAPKVEPAPAPKVEAPAPKITAPEAAPRTAPERAPGAHGPSLGGTLFGASMIAQGETQAAEGFRDGDYGKAAVGTVNSVLGGLTVAGKGNAEVAVLTSVVSGGYQAYETNKELTSLQAQGRTDELTARLKADDLGYIQERFGTNTAIKLDAAQQGAATGTNTAVGGITFGLIPDAAGSIKQTYKDQYQRYEDIRNGHDVFKNSVLLTGSVLTGGSIDLSKNLIAHSAPGEAVQEIDRAYTAGDKVALQAQIDRSNAGYLGVNANSNKYAIETATAVTQTGTTLAEGVNGASKATGVGDLNELAHGHFRNYYDTTIVAAANELSDLQQQNVEALEKAGTPKTFANSSKTDSAGRPVVNQYAQLSSFAHEAALDTSISSGKGYEARGFKRENDPKVLREYLDKKLAEVNGRLDEKSFITRHLGTMYDNSASRDLLEKQYLTAARSQVDDYTKDVAAYYKANPVAPQQPAQTQQATPEGAQTAAVNTPQQTSPGANQPGQATQTPQAPAPSMPSRTAMLTQSAPQPAQQPQVNAATQTPAAQQPPAPAAPSMPSRTAMLTQSAPQPAQQPQVNAATQTPAAQQPQTPATPSVPSRNAVLTQNSPQAQQPQVNAAAQQPQPAAATPDKPAQAAAPQGPSQPQQQQATGQQPQNTAPTPGRSQPTAQNTPQSQAQEQAKPKEPAQQQAQTEAAKLAQLAASDRIKEIKEQLRQSGSEYKTNTASSPEVATVSKGGGVSQGRMA